MKITVTNVSTSLKDLIVTAHGEQTLIDISNKMIRNVDTGVGVLLKNGPTNSIYFSNILETVTAANGFPIAASEAVSFDVHDLANVKLIAGVATQEVWVEIF